MPRYINFGAGPAALPLEVIQQAQRELLDWQGLGVSILELGHRTPEFMALAQEITQDLRALLAVPDNYKILFLLGGARVQFATLVMNLLRGKSKVDYFDTGYWSQCAIKEAQKYAAVNIVASASTDKPWHIPAAQHWRLDPTAAFCHYTENETISGIEFHQVPKVEVPLISDMTSSLLCKEIDISQFGMVYSGAQKNLGIAGMCVVIVREDLIGQALPITPSVYDYKIEADNASLYPTPPTFPWYVAGLVIKWMQKQGGIKKMAAENLQKARLLYDIVDATPMYESDVHPDSRSRMNVTFRLSPQTLEATFLQEAKQQGMVYLKGHKVLGGIRASLYNAISLADTQHLADFMRDFATRHG